jgi:two-component system invasion response regulator UvrY
MVNVLITDDHRLVRAGFRKILDEEPNITVIGEASNGKEALAFVQEHHPDLVLLDISMPGESGLDVLPKLKILPQPPKVVILSIHAGERVAQRAMELGADDYITKESAVEELVNSIRKLFPETGMAPAGGGHIVDSR